MKLRDFEHEFDARQNYESTCDNCGKVTVVRTQADGNPEYYTGVYVECGCGDWVFFNLPVN